MAATGQPKSNQPKIFIVEDEPLIALMLADMLADLDFTIAATAAQVPEALAILNDNIAMDAALLDVNLGSQKIDPVADLLAARGTPFVFTTGYGNAGVPAGHIGRPILQKPFHIDDLAAALRNVLGTAAD
ncbi:MAG TPA: response regulator [Methylovirgula sp.]